MEKLLFTSESVTEGHVITSYSIHYTKLYEPLLIIVMIAILANLGMTVAWILGIL